MLSAEPALVCPVYARACVSVWLCIRFFPCYQVLCLYYTMCKVKKYIYIQTREMKFYKLKNKGLINYFTNSFSHFTEEHIAVKLVSFSVGGQYTHTNDPL